MPAFRVQDTSTSSGQALPGDLTQQLIQQADGGAKAAVAVRQKMELPPPGFEKPKAAAAVTSNGAKPALLPIPSAWLTARALQPTAAVFDPTAGAKQQPQAEPNAASDAPSTSQQDQRAEVQEPPRTQSSEEDQGAKRSRTDQNMHGHRILREDTPEEAAPQLQQHLRQEDERVARPQLESSLATAEEEAHAMQPGEEDVQMAGSHRASDLAQNEEEETQGSQQGSGPDVEDVHMLGTTPPSSSGMQHLAATAASNHSSSQQASSSHICNVEKQDKVQWPLYKTHTACGICRSKRQPLSDVDVLATLCSTCLQCHCQPWHTASCNSTLPSAHDIIRESTQRERVDSRQC